MAGQYSACAIAAQSVQCLSATAGKPAQKSMYIVPRARAACRPACLALISAMMTCERLDETKTRPATSSVSSSRLATWLCVNMCVDTSVDTFVDTHVDMRTDVHQACVTFRWKALVDTVLTSTVKPMRIPKFNFNGQDQDEATEEEVTYAMWPCSRPAHLQQRQECGGYLDTTLSFSPSKLAILRNDLGHYIWRTCAAMINRLL